MTHCTYSAMSIVRLSACVVWPLNTPADAPAVKSRRAVKTLEIHQQNAIFKCCLLMEVKRLQIAERWQCSYALWQWWSLKLRTLLLLSINCVVIHVYLQYSICLSFLLFFFCHFLANIRVHNNIKRLWWFALSLPETHNYKSRSECEIQITATASQIISSLVSCIQAENLV